MEEQTDKKSYRLAWISVASLGIFFIVLGVAAVLLAQNGATPQTSKSNSSSSSSSTKVATKEEVQKGLDNLEASLKQAATAQAAAKAAIASKPVKVGN